MVWCAHAPFMALEGGCKTVKGREVIRRTVVSLSEAAEIGKVDNVVFDREARMAALLIKKRDHGRKELVATGIGNVRALGRDAITIDESEAVEGSEKVEELRGWPNLRQLVGCRVITEGGTYLGTVRDLLLDPETRRITDFELVGRGFLGRIRGDVIPATGRLRFGAALVIVPNAVAVKGRASLEQIVESAPAEALPAVGLQRTGEQTEVRAAGQGKELQDGELTRAVGG